MRFQAFLATMCLGLTVGCSGDDGGGSGDTDTSGGSTGTSDTAATDSGTGGTGGTAGSATGFPEGCGDGMVSGDEVCDDGNNVTESSPLEGGACAADCSMDLSLCGNGTTDPGEQCDDGNDDSYDDCTTSCTTNDKSFHAPCTCEGNECNDTDFSLGTIVGCDNVEVPTGAALACFRSANIFNVKHTFFAEGECGVISLVCEGAAVCPANIGDYAAHTACPAGTNMADAYVEELGAMINSKVCQKECESDIDCRWNAPDEFWMAPGQYRCQTTELSGGVKICVDAQND